MLANHHDLVDDFVKLSGLPSSWDSQHLYMSYESSKNYVDKLCLFWLLAFMSLVAHQFGRVKFWILNIFIGFISFGYIKICVECQIFVIVIFFNLGHYLLALLVYMDLEPPALKYLSSALNCQKTRNQYCQGEKVNGNCFRYFLLPGFLFNHSKTTYKVASFKCIEV